jgi:hypothetical protein
MRDSIRLKYLRIALAGIIFIFGIYSLMIACPSGWTFAHPFHMAEEESFGDETRQGSLIAFSR